MRTLGGNGEGNANHQFDNPEGVAVDPGEGGRVYVADSDNHRVQVFSKEGVYLDTICGNGIGDDNEHFDTPMDVCVEQGEGGHVYVADADNERVQVFSKAGAYVRTIKGSEFAGGPCSVVVDGDCVFMLFPTGGHVDVFLKP